MPAYRQDLSKAKDGTLTGKGGNVQQLGAAAQRRLKPPATAVTRPAVRPPQPARAPGLHVGRMPLPAPGAPATHVGAEPPPEPGGGAHMAGGPFGMAGGGIASYLARLRGGGGMKPDPLAGGDPGKPVDIMGDVPLPMEGDFPLEGDMIGGDGSDPGGSQFGMPLTPDPFKPQLRPNVRPPVNSDPFGGQAARIRRAIGRVQPQPTPQAKQFIY